MKVLERIGDFVSKYMAVLVILMAGAALAAPQTFAGIAPHVALLLGIVMFGMGTTVRAADFRRNLQRMAQHFGIPGGELSFRQGGNGAGERVKTEPARTG